MTKESASSWNPVSAETDEPTLQKELQIALGAYSVAAGRGLTDLAGACLARAGGIRLLLAAKTGKEEGK